VSDRVSLSAASWCARSSFGRVVRDFSSAEWRRSDPWAHCGAPRGFRLS
jgi:hypothetical protein